MEKKYEKYNTLINPASIVNKSDLKDVSKKDEAISYVLAQLKDFISMVEDPNHKRVFNTMIKKLEDAKKESVKEGGGIDDDKFNNDWSDKKKREEKEKAELEKATKKDLEDISSKVKSKEDEKLLEDKDWIQKAIKRPGALHRELGVPQDKDIPKSLINKTLSRLRKKDKDDEEEGTQLGAADERELRQLNLAKTLSKFNENKLTERIITKLREGENYGKISDKIRSHYLSEEDTENFNRIADLIENNNLKTAAEEIVELDTGLKELIMDDIKDIDENLLDIMFDFDDSGYLATARPKN